MTRQRFLSTFLFAAVLSPVMLYGDSCRPPATATLSALELRVGDFHGENVIEGFSPQVFSYEAMFPESESVGVLWVRAAHPSMAVDVYYDGLPVMLLGQTVAELDVPLGESELRIDVSTRQPPRDSNTYVVRIRRAPVFPCTEQGIREAIAHGGGPNYFDCDGPTHVPTASEIIIDNDVILDGDGEMIVDAGGGGAGGNGGGGPGGAGGTPFPEAAVSAKANGEHRVFSIPEGVTAELIGFTVTGGSTPEAGGGILNRGTLALKRCTLLANTADQGGGVANTGTLTMTTSAASGNSSTWGAGLHNASPGSMVVARSAVSDNAATRYGGGIYNHNDASAEVTDTTVSNNVAALAAGGISNRPGATMLLSGSVVDGNSAGDTSAGGISNAGTLTMDRVTVSSNSAPEDGGGVRNEEAGRLTVMGSTISGNTAMFGAGIRNFGQTEVINSMVINNTAGQAGGIANSGEITVTNTTVSDNEAGDEGGGMINYTGGTAELIDTTLSLNRSPTNGGGVVNGENATMTLANSAVIGNEAPNNGGGIANRGLLTLRDSSVSGNSSGSGGGIYVGHSGVLTLVGSTLSENASETAGGGIDIDGWVTVNNSTISGNSALSLGGGGLFNQGVLEVNDTSVSNNTGRSGGGIHNDSELVVRRSLVSSNSAPGSGGGILNTENGALTLMTTTVSGNTADTWSGGIRNLGAMNIVDTTVSNNTAPGGAGITNRPGSWMALTNSTVSSNVGNGISNWSTLILASVTVSQDGIVNDGGWITARNTIVDGDCTATPLLDSLGGNIESPGNTCFTPNPADQVSLTPEQLNLGALQDNGGPTWTHALLDGSFAIDSAAECLNWAGYPLFVDQRAATRPSGPACDSGAFELGGELLPQAQCVGDADRDAYESLSYVNSAGYVVSCIDAAGEMATHCVFGSSQTSPPIPGCPNEAAEVIECYPNCPPETIEAFGDCIASCTSDVTGLSAECGGCYGALGQCAAELCLVECASAPFSEECDLCRGQSGCNMTFDGCTGLPGETLCPVGAPQPTAACVNNADRAVYESLTYINGQDEFFTCIDAASEIGDDCVFGSPQSEPPIAGCGSEAGQVIGCFPNCPEEVIEAFGACVGSCTSGATGLSPTCGNCYGEAAACAAAFCTFSCVGDFNSPPCISCRVDNGCIPDFDECSGLPGEVDCSLIPNRCEGVDCDDLNPCTVDRCDPFTGICENDPVPNGMFCDTGEAPGFCTDGECIEDFCWSNPCDDGNPCTWDRCDSFEQICWNDPRPDGYYCFFDGGGGGSSGDGVCMQGECVEGPGGSGGTQGGGGAGGFGGYFEQP